MKSECAETAGCFAFNQYQNGTCEKIVGVWTEKDAPEGSSTRSGFFHDYCLEYQNLNYRKIIEFFIVYKLKGSTAKTFVSNMYQNSNGLFNHWNFTKSSQGRTSQIIQMVPKANENRPKILFAKFQIVSYLK